MTYRTLDESSVQMLRRDVDWPDAALRECYLYTNTRGIVEDGQVKSMASWAEPATGVVIFPATGDTVSYIKFVMYDMIFFNINLEQDINFNAMIDNRGVKLYFHTTEPSFICKEVKYIIGDASCIRDGFEFAEQAMMINREHS
jgi:hypothetical protein